MFHEAMSRLFSTSKPKETARPENLANAWRDELHRKKDELLKNPKTTLDQLVDLYWDQGIMERLTPSDSKIRQARSEKGSELWDGTREDKELYERILYSLVRAKDGIDNQHTMLSSELGAWAAIDASKVVLEKLSDRVPKIQNGTPDLGFVVQKFIDRAKLEYEKHGGSAEKVIQVGAVGEFDGIPVIVSAIKANGELWLDAKNAADHEKLFRAVRQREPVGYGAAILASKLDLTKLNNPE